MKTPTLLMAAFFGASTTACALELPNFEELVGTDEAASVEEDSCLPRIEAKGAWLAADGARGIPLRDGKAVYFFGDTALTAATKERPDAYEFVGNSIGIGRCAGGEFSIDYFWQESESGRVGFFDVGEDGVRLWPLDAFYRDGRLQVLLAKIIATDVEMGFASTGTVWATVDNPLEAPTAWSIRYQDFTGTDGFMPDKGITVDGEYAYIYSTLFRPTYPQPATLLRVPLDGLDAPKHHTEYLTEEGEWRSIARFNGQAKTVAAQPSVNMSVHYNEALGMYVTVHGSPFFGSPEMIVQTAPSLSGPWSEGIVVYEFPEMLAPRDDGAIVACYAVTEHPEFRMNGGTTLVVTYSCNTIDAPLPAREDLDIYLPKTITIDLGSLQSSALQAFPVSMGGPKSGMSPDA